MFSVTGAGQPGAAKLLKLMRNEIDMTLAQIGCTSLDGLAAGHREAEPS